MEVKIYRQSVTIGYFEVDVQLRLAPASYWRILQNAAASHAALLAASTEELRRAGQTWMLSKMRLDIARHPTLGDTVEVETWPTTKLKGARAYRDFVLKNAAGEICATASSLWVIVDLATRRPQRIPDSIVALRVDPGYAIPELSEASLPLPDPVADSSSLRATWSDADQNEHINNVAVLRWAIDALPLSFLETNALASAEVHYRAELKIGETVSIQSSASGREIEQAVLSSQGAVAAIVRTTWLHTAHVAP